MKKVLIIIGIIAVIIVIAWFSVFMVDRHQTFNLKEPVFAKLINDKDTSYKGMGYTIEIERGIDNEIIGVTMYMFNKVVAAAIT